jgi:hypothetical protein
MNYLAATLLDRECPEFARAHRLYQPFVQARIKLLHDLHPDHVVAPPPVNLDQS